MNNADKNIELKVKEIIDSKIAFDDSNGDERGICKGRLR